MCWGERRGTNMLEVAVIVSGVVFVFGGQKGGRRREVGVDQI